MDFDQKNQSALKTFSVDICTQSMHVKDGPWQMVQSVTLWWVRGCTNAQQSVGFCCSPHTGQAGADGYREAAEVAYGGKHSLI